MNFPFLSRLKRVVVWALAVVAVGNGAVRAATDAATEMLIHSVERHYNQVQTLNVDFTETYTLGGRSRRPESGSLVLRKPGRMRWTYTQPAGKLFVSDGQNVFLYTAADNRVERSTLKASEDLRAPMAFLLGKLDFHKEFRNFAVQPDGNGNTGLVAEARNDRLPYGKIQLLVAPDSTIRQLTVSGRDGSELGFVFRNEVVNPSVPDTAFRFTPPPGAEVVDAVNVNTAPGGEN